MPLLSIPFPDISPVIFTIFGLSIRWYGVSYLLGFVVGYLILCKMVKRGLLPLTKEQVWDFLAAAMLGVILGGRLGYVIIYKPLFYLSNPLQIPAIWDGGMSFHGGLLGVGLACRLFCRKRGIPTFSLIDSACVAAAPGLFFTRTANFINQELWGRQTDVPWAVIFSDPAAGGVPRHPSQLYEGLLEGAALFFVLWWLSHRTAFQRRGALTAAFIVGYGCFRFIVEFYREPDRHLGTILGPLSMGHLLCAVMILGGVWGLGRVFRRPREES